MMKALRLQPSALRQQILRTHLYGDFLYIREVFANHLCFNRKRHEAETWKITVRGS